MSKALVYRLFRLGAFPRHTRPVLEAEGVVVAEEGLRGVLVMRDVRGPGRRHLRRVEGFAGCLVVTRRRLLCYTYWKRQISIALDDPKLRCIHVDAREPGRLSVSFESSEFREGWRGILELRFRTERARAFLDALLAAGARQGHASDEATRGS